ncbi:MAG: hypothetical protein ACLQDC_11885 [Verrucomicrobiia bacterium]
MKYLLAAKGTRTIVDKCAFVKEGESVFIVTDFETFAEAKLIAEAAVAAGANVTMGSMSTRELDGQEPEKTVAAAMKEADVNSGHQIHWLAKTVTFTTTPSREFGLLLEVAGHQVFGLNPCWGLRQGDCKRSLARLSRTPNYTMY